MAPRESRQFAHAQSQGGAQSHTGWQAQPQLQVSVASFSWVAIYCLRDRVEGECLSHLL